MPTGQPNQPAHETSPAEFLEADQAAYAEAAIRARDAARAAAEPRRPYPERRRARRAWIARRLRIG